MPEGVKLLFTSHVLGREAAVRLRLKQVTQTIRSFREAQQFFRMRGDRVGIVLDREYLYYARITEIEKKPLQELGRWDAEIGGFNQLYELQDALRRAGFRFKPLQDYENTWAIQFLPQREEAKVDA